jgi:hypothetical protein
MLLLMSCAPAGGPGGAGGGAVEGIDPSIDRYKAETFLDNRESGPSFEAGTGLWREGGRGRESKDLFTRFRTRSISGAARIRVTGDISREAFHLSATPARSLRIDLGDIVPDIGIGLVSSARRFTFPFSPQHPLYPPKGIRGWTGFYGAFIRGGSVQCTAGVLRTILVAGRPAGHGSEGVEYSDGGGISGLRIEAGGRTISGGLTAMNAGSREGGRIAGIDLICSSGVRRIMFETAATSLGDAAAAWGMTIDGKDLDCGMILWSVPSGTEGILSSFPGLLTASGFRRSGASMTLRVRCPRRIQLSAWGELRRSGNGEVSETGSAARLEARIGWRRGVARCAWSSRVNVSEDLIPFPPALPRKMEGARNLTASISFRPARYLDLVLELKTREGETGEGMLGAARVSLSLQRFHSRLLVSAATFRSTRGRTVFSLYEPSGGGRYPWKRLYGGGSRVSFGIDMKAGGMRASLWLLWTSEGRAESAVRMTVAI